MNFIQPQLAFAYYRLSQEDIQRGEQVSSSIENQRRIVEDYCKRNNVTIVRDFSDDGWSGGNFDRPRFNEMLAEIDKQTVNVVIAKDLSRLGRDMNQASFFAEKYFPEHGIRFLTVTDGFDSRSENTLAPLQFAVNEFYLRDGSKKVRAVLKNKREDGLYCACPPYGYRKDASDKNRLVPDEATAPIVKRIFAAAKAGDSSRRIAGDLNADGIIPPLKYRALYRDDFSDKGLSRVSDLWNYTTVKRILKNRVYLGHTILGRTRKVSIKSKKKEPVPVSEWAVTENTHEPLVSEETFRIASENMGRNTTAYRQYDNVRKSIFSGIATCAACGHALCSCGTVYKGEREKYWYLSCTRKRKDVADPCTGVRIRYADLVALVTDDLNRLIDASEEEIAALAEQMREDLPEERELSRKAIEDKTNARLGTIKNALAKAYTDNAEGKLDDEQLHTLVVGFQQETKLLERSLAEVRRQAEDTGKEENFRRLVMLARHYTHIGTLDRETLLTFIERIEVGPKILPDGMSKPTHRNSPFTQEVHIFYRFTGELPLEEVKHAKIPG